MTDVARLGRYEILGEIGRGAMGVVYRGFDPQLERHVAIKAIRADAVSGGTEEEIVARFLREAKLAARIGHPGVVTVFDAGEDQGQLYLVMELVDGESLAARLRRGAFPTQREALTLAAQVAEALGAAHQVGVIHRDVKPANILISKDGRVKVSDFGVAKAVGEATGLTRTGTTVGSPAYMSPEQVRGEHVDARSDLFSLGVILYEMLFRKRPFPAETLTTLVYQILNADPFADPQVFGSLPGELVGFLQRCLAKEPARRIPDAAAFVAQARALAQKLEVEATVSSVPTVAMPAISSSRTPTTASSKPAPSRRGIWLGLLGVAIVGLGAFMLFRRPSPPPATVLLGKETPLAQEPGDNLTQIVPSPQAASTPSPTPLPTPTPTVAPAVTGGEPSVSPTLPPAATPTAVPTPTPTPTPPPPVVQTYRGRRGAVFNVDPEDALVEIDGRAIGRADDWDGKGGGKVYVFPGPGTYYAKLSLHGYRAVWVAIVIDPSASTENADVDWEMEEL